MDDRLMRFYQSYAQPDFDSVVAEICTFYALPKPTIEWYQWIDGGKTLGKTYEDGTIELLHPEDWKQRKTENTARRWIAVFYHEMGHHILWADAETKADRFARKFIAGIKSAGSDS